MTTIIVTHEDNEVDEFDFDNGPQVISIGRRSTNDVCIPNLSVSGVHARVTIEDNIARIEDNNSTNGTYVNGRLISRQILNNGDEIVIGKTRVMVNLEAQDVEPPVLTTNKVQASDDEDLDIASDLQLDHDDSFVPGSRDSVQHDHYDDEPMSLSDKAKLALGRQDMGRQDMGRQDSSRRDVVRPNTQHQEQGDTAVAAIASEDFVNENQAVERPAPELTPQADAHPLDGIENVQVQEAVAEAAKPASTSSSSPMKTAGAVIEIQNGAKSGQILPIDKPVTTLGRPGIQIAAIMRKPDGYFLMHIESDDSVDMPTLNRDTIGDEPVMLQSGDRLNVAGIDVEFMLS